MCISSLQTWAFALYCLVIKYTMYIHSCLYSFQNMSVHVILCYRSSDVLNLTLIILRCFFIYGRSLLFRSSIFNVVYLFYCFPFKMCYWDFLKTNLISFHILRNYDIELHLFWWILFLNKYTSSHELLQTFWFCQEGNLTRSVFKNGWSVTTHLHKLVRKVEWFRYRNTI